MDMGGFPDEVDEMIVIAGSNGGIGKFLREKYVSLGENVKSFSHDEVDITRMLSIDNWMQKTIFDDDISLINCTGYTSNAILSRSDPIEWRKTIEINLIGTYNLLHRFLPLMRKSSFGRILLFSSVVAQKGIKGTSAYAASKSALWGLSKAVSVENVDKGINVNCVNLGYTDAGMITKVPVDIQERLREEIPMKRFAYLQEVYNAVEYFRNNPYSTGTSLDLNGGLV